MERSLAQAVEVLAAILALVIGLSHVAQPRAWAEFFVRLRGWGRAGVFVNGFLSLGFGAVVVAFHPAWTGPGGVLTALGWAQVAKGLVSFVFPRAALRSLERVSPERPGGFVAAGLLLLGASAACGYAALAP
jgi:hypothetical protein